MPARSLGEAPAYWLQVIPPCDALRTLSPSSSPRAGRTSPVGPGQGACPGWSRGALLPRTGHGWDSWPAECPEAWVPSPPGGCGSQRPVPNLCGPGVLCDNGTLGDSRWGSLRNAHLEVKAGGFGLARPDRQLALVPTDRETVPSALGDFAVFGTPHLRFSTRGPPPNHPQEASPAPQPGERSCGVRVGRGHRYVSERTPPATDT